VSELQVVPPHEGSIKLILTWWATIPAMNDKEREVSCRLMEALAFPVFIIKDSV